MRPRRRRKAASVSSGSDPDARPVCWSVHTISHRVHGPAVASRQPTLLSYVMLRTWPQKIAF